MAIFLSLIFFFFPMMVLEITTKKNAIKNTFIYFFVFLYYIFFTGLRWKTGTDWLSYENAFDVLSRYSSQDLGATFEPGYSIFMGVFSKTVYDFSAFLIFQSMLIAFFIYKTAKISKAPPVSFLFCLLITQSQFFYPVRQQLAISIVMYALSCSMFIKSESFKKTTFLMFIASSIHLSSVVAFFSIILESARSRLIYGFVVLSLMILMYFLFEQFYLEFFESRFFSYFVKNDYSFDSSRNVFRILERILAVMLLSFIYFNKVLNCYSIKNQKDLRNLILFGFAISISTIYAFPYFARFAPYFSWAEALVLSISLSNLNKLSKKIQLIILLLLIIYFIKLIFSILSYWDLLNPYYFRFESFDRGLY